MTYLEYVHLRIARMKHESKIRNYRVVYVWHYGLPGYLPDSSYYFETKQERKEFLKDETQRIGDMLSNPEIDHDIEAYGYYDEIDNNMFSDSELDSLLENGHLPE